VHGFEAAQVWPRVAEPGDVRIGEQHARSGPDERQNVEPAPALRLLRHLGRVDRVHAHAERAQLGRERNVLGLRSPHVHHAHEQPADPELLQVVDPVLGEVRLPRIAECHDHRVVDRVLAHQPRHLGGALHPSDGQRDGGQAHGNDGAVRGRRSA